MIGGGCSSVHNMSLAILLWTTVAMLFKIRIDRGYLLIGLAMVAFMFLLNVLRLSTIGLFPDHFYFLHFGAGADMFGWAGLIGAALLAGAGVNICGGPAAVASASRCSHCLRLDRSD